MDNQEFCQGCEQQHSCQEVYRQLGNTKGPSVALKAVAAFLLPLMVFIATLAVSEAILAKLQMQTAIGFLPALLAAFICILITKAVNKRFNKKQTHQI